MRSNPVNRLLKRQLKHVYGSDFDLAAFDSKTVEMLKLIEEVYDENDKEKRLLDHTIQLNTEELMQAYNTIEKHNESLKDEVDEKNRLLQQYQDAIDDTFIVAKTDTKGILTYVNDTLCKTSGYRREELLGQPHSIVRSPNMKKSFFEEIWKTIQQKKIWQGTIENKNKNGDFYYVDAAIFPLTDSNGTIVEYVTIKHDITARIETEKNLDRARRYSQHFFDEQEDIVMIIHGDRGIIKVNRNFLEILGYETLDDYKAVHQCICELFAKKEGYLHQDASQHWTETILRHPKEQHKAIITNKNSQDRIYAVRIKEVNFDEDSYMIASFTDISELELARELAEDSEKAKAQFMAHMSHEIRTPMNSIIGFTNLLRKGELNAKQEQYAELIGHSTHILLQITNDILDFSKIESGHLELHMTNVNPFIDLRNSISIFSSEAREKNISFTANIDSSLKESIRIDELRVTQVLSNLISNAIKFTAGNGRISIDISHLSTQENKEVILFSVSDTGIGISPDRIEQIFHSFIQADASTTRNFGGTGLGLSISASLCELMGTKLEVESREGEGSRFFFTLETESCEPTKTLAEQIQNPPIYILHHTKSIYNDVIHQLKNFGISFKAVTLEEFIAAGDNEHIVISFDYMQYKPLSTLTKKIILFDEHQEAFALAENEQSIYHTGSFKKCPSLLYNAIWEMNLLKDQKIKNGTEKTQFNLTVLVAEDYDINRILVDEILQSYGIKADFAFNGLEAVEKTIHKTYDIIFMDINMPVINGIEAMKMIHKRNIQTPIIALTANALEGDREYYLSQGMDNCISKPIDANTLYRVLEQYAGKKNTVHIEYEPLPAKETAEENSIADDEIITALHEAKKRMKFSTPIMKRLYESFVTNAHTDTEELLDAVEKNDRAFMKIKAHGLRGCAFSLGFTEIGELCRMLEHEEKTDPQRDHLSLAKEIKRSIDHMYHTKNTILAKLAESDESLAQ